MSKRQPAERIRRFAASCASTGLALAVSIVKGLRFVGRQFVHMVSRKSGYDPRAQQFPSESGMPGVIESESASAPQPGPLVREGNLVQLRRHAPENRSDFQRWYADPEIANLLRHDLRPLNDRQSRGYFDSIILPMSAAGLCFAIHDRATDQLIGTTALTDTDDNAPGARLFRVVIGEKPFWDRGYGTEVTQLVVSEAFDTLGLNEVRLEVFAHNPRAIAVYERVGFVRTGEHFEYLGPNRPQLHVFEMSIFRPDPTYVQEIVEDLVEAEQSQSPTAETDAVSDPV